MKFVVYRSSNTIEPFVMEIETLEHLCDYIVDNSEMKVVIWKRYICEKDQDFEDVDFALEIDDDWRE